MRFVHSIFFKLFLSFLLLSILPLSMAGILTNHNVSSLLNKQLSQDTSSILEQNAKVLGIFLNDLNRMGEIVSRSSAVSQFLKSKDDNEFLRSFLPLDQSFDSIQLIRPENVGMTLISDRGYVYHYGYGINRENLQFYTADWMPKLNKLSEKPLLTSLHQRPYSYLDADSFVFSYVKRISSIDAKAKGVLMIDFKQSILADLFPSTYFKKDSSSNLEAGLLITNDKGQVLYPDTQTPFTQAEIPTVTHSDRIVAPNDESYQLVTLFNQETGWTLTGYFEEKKLYQPIQYIHDSIYWIVVPSIAFCLLASLFISHRISTPVRSLQRLMKKAGRGDFQQIAITSKDEIGELSRGFNQMVHKIEELLRQVYEEQNQKRRAEMAALQSQINPHFLYNTLESINSLARKHKESQISKMIVHLGRLMRLSISTFDEMIPINQELDYVGHYIELHKHRFPRSLTYSIEIDEEIRRLYTVKWILQPIVENAILHGLESRSVEGHIAITGWLAGEDVYLQVSDNGTGMEPQALQELRKHVEHQAEQLTKYGKKVGMCNVQSRLRYHFGTAYGIQLSSEPGKGMTVTFKLPRREQNEEEKAADCG